MVAEKLDEVVPLLIAAEDEARAGNHVALMLSYEAAPAFDSALVAHPAASLPRAWATVFESDSQPLPEPDNPYSLTSWHSQTSEADYHKAIQRIHDLIARGDTYQVNFSMRATARFTGDPFSCYRNLHLAQGSGYSVYLDLGRHKILSLSPELFFERRGNIVRTKPMKGTISRGRWPAEDAAQASMLRNSAKEKAENVMIVDLLRNDLGKVSVTGSVKVSSLFELERYETVWQMTSTVESRLKPETTLVDLMTALFPCGSVTGAPKIRTMEIINELERDPRGVYTGTVGLMLPGGDSIFNVAIRTIIVDSETGLATFGVGGGITIDSTAEREYEECRVKTNFLNSPAPAFDLFESLLVENGECFLPDGHLLRLKNSAQFFGFPFSESNFLNAVSDCQKRYPNGSWKARIALAKDGKLTTSICAVTSPETLRVGVATKPVDSADRFLFHKTTNRRMYEEQLAEHPGCDDVLFFNERGEITESTIANLVVNIGGELFTPPVESGLLAGTFRNHLIEKDEIVERTIMVNELQAAKEIFLINSVRKWMKVVLI